MNAYELANLLEKHYDVWLPDECVGAPDMLRHQADQITDLQTTIKFLEEECKSLRSQVNT